MSFETTLKSSSVRRLLAGVFVVLVIAVVSCRADVKWRDGDRVTFTTVENVSYENARILSIDYESVIVVHPKGVATVRRAEFDEQHRSFLPDPPPPESSPQTAMPSEVTESSPVGPSGEPEVKAPRSPRILGDLVPPPRKEGAAPYHPLKFKGLSLGMRIEDAHRRMEELLDEGLHGKERERIRLERITEDDIQGLYFTLADFSGRSYIQADSDWRVISFGLSPMVVNVLFNAGGMDPAAFGQQFIDSYGIPRLEPATDRAGWFYYSEDGLRVNLEREKWLVISFRSPARFD